jgi:diaminopimelate decarboxylase
MFTRARPRVRRQPNLLPAAIVSGKAAHVGDRTVPISSRQNRGVLALFPDSAAVEDGELSIGGLRATELAETFGTPLVVYCEATLRARVRAYREAAPAAHLVYGVKAFPNVAVLRVLVEEGMGADVSTAGELEFARRAGVPPERLVVHGNNKSDAELRTAAEIGAGLVVLDALEEVDRAVAAGVARVLVRVTPGIEAETHEAIRTAQLGSKFGLAPEQALEAIAAALAAKLDARGLHVHIGSQLLDTSAARTTVEWVAAFAARCRAELAWTPVLVDLGGGLGITYVEDEPAPSIAEFARAIAQQMEEAWQLQRLTAPTLVLEPGRSIVGPAGTTLYRVGVVKRATATQTYVAIDGGMSDNPRPQLYGAQLSALLANRADEEPTGVFAVAGKHCESGDVLIRAIGLPEPRRGDLLAVPATGAYTLAMASNYNGVPRPAAVLVRGGRATVIRRRETVEDLLEVEVQ